MEPPKYTIVVNTYPYKERGTDLVRCLNSLFSQTYQTFCILLIENYKNSSQINKLIETYSKEKSRITLLVDQTKKLSFLFNLGWKNSKTEYLAYIADDAEADKNWLFSINEELSREETGVVTGPVISTSFPAGEMHRLFLLSQKNTYFKILSFPYLHFAMEDNVLQPGKLFESGAYSIGAGLEQSKDYPRQEIDLATTTSMGIKKTVLMKVNGFDEHFNFNHADGDLFLRIKQAGFKIIFTPKVKALHHVRIGPSRNAYFIGKDTALFYKKHIRPKSLDGLIGALLNIMLLNFYWVYATLKTKDLKQLKGISGFLEGLFS
ncbi:MAG: glycosyltransferase [Patescibacteria group bacterium]